MFHHVPICSTAHHCLHSLCVFIIVHERDSIPLCPFESALLASLCPRVSNSLACLKVFLVLLITRADIFSKFV